MTENVQTQIDKLAELVTHMERRYDRFEEDAKGFVRRMDKVEDMSKSTWNRLAVHLYQSHDDYSMGTVTTAAPTPPGDGDHGGEIACPNCDGEKVIYFDDRDGGDGAERCQVCEGRGVIPAPDALREAIRQLEIAAFHHGAGGPKTFPDKRTPVAWEGGQRGKDHIAARERVDALLVSQIAAPADRAVTPTGHGDPELVKNIATRIATVTGNTFDACRKDAQDVWLEQARRAMTGLQIAGWRMPADRAVVVSDAMVEAGAGVIGTWYLLDGLDEGEDAQLAKEIIEAALRAAERGEDDRG